MSVIDKLKKALGEDAEKYAGVLGEVEDEIKSVQSKFERIQQDLTDVKNESIERRKKIRDELTPKIESLEDTNLKLQKQIDEFDNDPLKTEVETLKQQNEKLVGQFKTTVTSKIKEFSKHPNFGKAVRKFKIPLTEDGKINEDKLGEMPNEDVLHNSEIINELEELDYFAPVKPGGVPPIPPGTGTKIDGLREQLKNAKTPQERDKIAEQLQSQQTA